MFWSAPCDCCVHIYTTKCINRGKEPEIVFKLTKQPRYEKTLGTSWSRCWGEEGWVVLNQKSFDGLELYHSAVKRKPGCEVKLFHIPTITHSDEARTELQIHVAEKRRPGNEEPGKVVLVSGRKSL
ncbi:hypothetical protein AMECASPLE_015895 [Ameca splendens]|uniref:Uncharacterized protein n=1 Tax=Ameca splendens TaxID=208324 RepID=A0ABV0YPE8_9TELE